MFKVWKPVLPPSPTASSGIERDRAGTTWVMRQRRRQPSVADVFNEAAAELEALAKAEASPYSGNR
jgi:hypothetical protein